MTENQDECVSIENFCSDPLQFLFGVFDGHGTFGTAVARWVKLHLPSAIQANPLYSANHPDDVNQGEAVRLALRDSFMSTDSALLNLDVSGIDTELSGCTATIALIRSRDLFVAHVGDSRVVLGRQEEESGVVAAVALTEDHCPHLLAERVRIEQNGGRIVHKKNMDGHDVGPPRVYHMDIRYPGLAVTRSMGDKFGKTLGVSADPDVFHRRLDVRDKFVIISSDGVWSCMTSQDAVDVVAHHTDPQQAAEALTQLALEQLDTHYHRDNITVLVVFLSPDALDHDSELPVAGCNAAAGGSGGAGTRHAFSTWS